MSALNRDQEPMALDLNTRIGGSDSAHYLAAFRVVRDTGVYEDFVRELPKKFKMDAIIGRTLAPNSVAGRYDAFLCKVCEDMRPVKFVRDGRICADLLIGPFEDGLLPLWGHDWSCSTPIEFLPELTFTYINLMDLRADDLGIETFWRPWGPGQVLWRQSSAKNAFEVIPFR